MGLRSGPNRCLSPTFVHISRYFSVFQSSKSSDIYYFCPPTFTLPVKRVNEQQSNRRRKGLSSLCAFLACPISPMDMHTTSYSRHYEHRKHNNMTQISPMNLFKKIGIILPFSSPEGLPRMRNYYILKYLSNLLIIKLSNWNGNGEFSNNQLENAVKLQCTEERRYPR